MRSSGTSSSAQVGIHAFWVRNAALGSAPVSEPITVEVISKRRCTGRPTSAGFGGTTMIAEPFRRPGATEKRGFWKENFIVVGVDSRELDVDRRVRAVPNRDRELRAPPHARPLGAHLGLELVVRRDVEPGGRGARRGRVRR